LDRRIVEGHGIDALLLEPAAGELALARGRGEAAVCERREALRHRELLPALRLQLVPAHALHAGLGGSDGGAADVFVGIAEARLVEAQARGEAAEDLGIRQRFAKRR